MRWVGIVGLGIALACNPAKKPASEDAGATVTASASAPASSAPIVDTDKCVVAIDHGVRIGVGDTERATLAAGGSDAALAIVENWATTVTVRAVLGSTFPKVKFTEAPGAIGAA